MTEDDYEGQTQSTGEAISVVVEDAIESIKGESVTLPVVPYRLVEKHYNKTTKLLSNSGSEVAIDSRNRWHDYDFKSPLFISFIRVVASGFNDYHEFKFKAKLSDGGSKEYTTKKNGDAFTVSINEFVKSISFKPPRVWFDSPVLTRVIIWGFYKDDISDFLSHFAKIDRIKNETIAEIKNEKDTIDRSIATLLSKEEQLSDIDSAIEENERALEIIKGDVTTEKQRLSELDTQISAISSQLETISDQIEDRKAEIGTLTAAREDIRLQIARANSELKRLRENINLFPSEIAGFVTQAGNDIRSYIHFSAGLVSIICILFIWVLTGAFDLSEFVKNNPNVNIGPLLLAKMPLAIVVSSLVAACYKISRVFIEEILKINRQKLSLTQVSIIAKDVSQSAEAGLGFTEHETYALRLRTKMAMLGDHIKTFIPSDPSRLFPRNVSDVFGDPNEDKCDVRQPDAVLALPQGDGDEPSPET